MTGLPTLTVLLDDANDGGTFPHDVTGYVHLPSSWNVTRGRGDEFDTVQPSELKLRFDNRDGRFTLGAPVSDVHIDQRIRIIETVGSTVSVRFTGYVQDWPVKWPNPQATYAVADVTAVCRLARLARRKLKSMIANEMALIAPYSYYPLQELVGATTAGDASGNQRPSLVRSGPLVVFGTTIPGVEYMGMSLSGSAYLESTAQNIPTGVFTMAAVVWGTATPATDAYFAVASATPEYVGLILTSTGRVTVQQQPVSTGTTEYATSTTVVTDGLPHRVLATLDGGTLKLYIDGVLEASTAGTATSSDGFTQLALQSPGVVFTLAHFAYDTVAWTAAQVTADANAALARSTDSSDERIARFAAYANIAPADQSLEAGVLTDTAAQSTDGVFVLDAMNEAAESEGGAVFIDGNGALTFHNRTHRALNATSTPALAVDGHDVDHDGLVISGDKQYLENYITGSRPNGAVQLAFDETSINTHEQYPAEITRSLLLTDDQVLDLINWRIANYSTPKPRLSSLPVDLLTQSQAVQEAVLALELGDRITLSLLPIQSPMAVGDLIIEGWTETQTHDSWVITFNTSPASFSQAWILGDATFGVLGTTSKLFY